MSELLSVDEAASYLRVSSGHVMRMARAGVLEGFKPGRSWVFTREQLDAFLAARCGGRVPLTGGVFGRTRRSAGYHARREGGRL